MLPSDLDPSRIPRHVAVVMDGNGRWARQRGLKRTQGHEAGEEALFEAVEGALELVENTPFFVDRMRAQAINSGDSIVNSVGDMLAMVAGFLLAARLPAWVTVLLLLAAEAALLWLIRDSLTLGAIMLIYPVDAIKQWQLAG